MKDRGPVTIQEGTGHHVGEPSGYRLPQPKTDYVEFSTDLDEDKLNQVRKERDEINGLLGY